MQEQWRNLRDWWLTVNTREPEQKQHRQLLTILLAGLLALVLALTAINVIQLAVTPSSENIFFVVGDVFTALALVGLWSLNRGGYTRWASYILLILLVLGCSTLIPMKSLDRTLIIYAVPIMAASFLIGPGSSFVFALLFALGYSLARLADGSLLTYNYISVLTLFMMALLAWLIAARLENDITERKRAEKELRQANRTLRVISASDLAVAHATEESQLLQEICQIIVQVGEYRLAWVGFAEQDEEKTVRPVAQAGYEEGYLQTVNIVWSDTERGQGPTGKAIRTRQSSVARNILTDPDYAPWRAEAIQRGYAASIALPLMAEGYTLGALNIYAAEAEAFDLQEVDLLTELAGDLAYGIVSLRARVEARRVEEALRLSEERYRIITESMSDVVWLLDMNLNLTYVSPSGQRLRGYTFEELEAMPLYQQLAPSSLEYVLTKISQELTPEKLASKEQAISTTAELEMYRKDGSTLWMEGTFNLIRDTEGRPTGIVGVGRDITERKCAGEDIRRHVRRLETLNEIGRAITSTLDLDGVLRTLLEQVREAADAEAASVALVESPSTSADAPHAGGNEGGNNLVFRQAVGEGTQTTIGLRLKSGQGIAGWVAAHRQSAFIPDASSDPRFYGNVHHGSGFITRDVVCVPLIARDAVIGVLELVNKRNGLFNENDVRLLEAVATQAAIALENARLFQIESDDRRRLETLYRISQAVNSTLEAGTILDRLTDEAVRATRATHGSALVARPDLGYFERRSLRGYSPAEVERARRLPLFFKQGVNGRAYQTQQVVYLADTQTATDYFPLISETRSELAVPILRGGQALGNLDLQSPEVDAFHDVDLEFLRALTDQVAIALENARLFDEARRRADEMAVVSSVALVGAAGRPFDETVTRATDALNRLWPEASMLGFLFVDQVAQSLRLHPSYRGVPPERMGMTVPLDRGITGWAAQKQQPVRVGDVFADPRYFDGGLGTRSEMAAPLIVSGHAIGAINVESPLLDAFSGDDLRLLTTLAGQLAILFEKARLDAELAEHAAMLERRVEERTAEIRREQARTQSILDASGESVIVIDADGKIQYINPATEALTGFSADDVVGLNPRLRLRGQTPLPMHGDMWNTILSGQTWRGEIVNRRKDGTPYDALLTIAPIPGGSAESQPVSCVAVQLDITQRKRAEEETRRALAKEKELGELKSRFVSMTSHEFRTPLSTILSSAELLEHYGSKWTDERKLVHFHRIQTAVQNMTYLMDSVLFIGRAEAGKLEFNPVSLELVQFCRDLVEEMQLSAGPQHAINFVSQDERIQARVDEKLLRQILANLISNAVKYSPQGSTVHCELACQPDQAIFRVKDAGIGIPPEDQTRLFETFQRAKNVGNISGTGLGLTIVKKCVDLHGGTIGVESQLGAGTTFTVVLPIMCGA